MSNTKYYKIEIDNNKIILVKVKKDFYAEGISLEDDTLLQGYMYFGKDFCLNILNNKDTLSTLWEHKGIIGNQESGTSQVYLDEEFIDYDKKDTKLTKINELTDKKLCDEISYRIRNSIRNLTDRNQKIYSYFYARRRDKFSEMKSAMTHEMYKFVNGEYISKIPIDEYGDSFTRDDLEEISNYLDNLIPNKKIKKGRDENNKKLRKRRKNK